MFGKKGFYTTILKLVFEKGYQRVEFRYKNKPIHTLEIVEIDWFEFYNRASFGYALTHSKMLSYSKSSEDPFKAMIHIKPSIWNKKLFRRMTSIFDKKTFYVESKRDQKISSNLKHQFLKILFILIFITLMISPVAYIYFNTIVLHPIVASISGIVYGCIIYQGLRYALHRIN